MVRGTDGRVHRQGERVFHDFAANRLQHGGRHFGVSGDSELAQKFHPPMDHNEVARALRLDSPQQVIHRRMTFRDQRSWDRTRPPMRPCFIRPAVPSVLASAPLRHAPANSPRRPNRLLPRVHFSVCTQAYRERWEDTLQTTRDAID